MSLGTNWLRAPVCATAIGTICLLTAPAVAQEAAGEGEASQIIVTAQFRSQNLQDVPVAITAMTGEMLEQRGQTSLADIGSTAPNVTLRQAPATYGPAVVAYIRGVGQRDTSFALEPGVGIYVDDVYLPTLHGSMLNLIDLERVEILRGPQGTLSGQNSIGGSIRLSSKKPSGETDGFLSATYGSYNRLEVRGGANFTLDDERLFARVSGAAVRKDGYITRYDYRCTHPTSTIPSVVTGTDCELGTEGGKSYVAGRLALRWLPSDAITVDLSGDMTRDNSEVGPTTLLYVGRAAAPGSMLTGVAAVPSAAFVLNGNVYGTATGSPYIAYSPYGDFAQDTFSDSPYISYENYTDIAPRDGSAPWQAPLRGSINSWGVSGNITAELSENFTLTSITAYREFDGVYSSGDGSPFSNTLQSNYVYNHQFSQEVRLTGNIGDVFNFTAGGFYFDKNSRTPTRITLPTLDFRGDNEAPSTTKAVFLNAELTPIDAITILGGIRYTDITKSYSFARLGNPGSNSGGLPPASLAGLNGLVGTFSGERVDYRAVLQYRMTDDIMAYAQFATGFKAGGINPRPFFAAQALAFGPETLDAYELGFKTMLFDNRARFNASAFLNKYDDILVTVSSCPLPGVPAAPCALPINAGSAEVKGFEAELNLTPFDGMVVDLSLAHLTFKYTSISAAAATSGIGLEDKGIYVSPWQWSIGAQYEIDLGSSGSLTPRIDIQHEDAFNRNPNNVDAATGNEDIFGLVAGRTLANARLTYETGNSDWEIALEVRNLTDKLYYSDVFDNRGSTQSIQGSPGEPRTWAVIVKRHF